MLNLLIGLLLLGTLHGCASLNVDPYEYPEAPLERAQHLPSEQALAGKPIRIAVSKFDIAGSGTAARLAHNAGLAAVMATTLESYIDDTGARVIDRSDAESLTEEVIRVEEAGGVYQGQPIADYVVRGTVDGASISKRFQEEERHTDDEGKEHVTPAKCKYTAAVSGRIRVYKMPSLEVATTVPLEQQYTSAEDARNAACPIGAQHYQYLRKAAQYAVANARAAVLNQFAPKGYVLTKRTDGKTYLFKISIGKNKNLQKGMRVKIFTRVDVKNEITGKVSTETRQIAVGRITDEIAAKHAWILVKDERSAERIKLGDFVKVHFGGPGLFEALGQGLHQSLDQI